MIPTPPRDNPAAMHERAEHLREAIAARAGRLRRDAARMVPGMPTAAPERARALRLPGWAVAAVAGAVAGLVAALRRRSRR